MLCIKQKKTAIAVDIKSEVPHEQVSMHRGSTKGTLKNTSDSATGIRCHSGSYLSMRGKSAFMQHHRGTKTESGRRRFLPLGDDDQVGRTLRLWPLSAMVQIADISDEDAESLIALSQRSYGYEASA